MRIVHASAGGFSTCLAASLLLANAAHAQGFEQPWRGVYLGGGGTYSTVSVEVPGSGCYDYDCWWGDYDYYEEGDGDFSYSLHAGLRVHDFVALEATYVDTGSIRWDENLVYFPEFNDYYNNRVDFSAQITEVSVLGILPAGRFELYLRLGAGFWDATSEQLLDQSFGTDVVTRSVRDSGTGFLGGVGVGVTFAEAVHVRFEVQSTTIDEDVLNARDDASIDSMLLEVQYRFGARQAPAAIQPSGPPTATP